MPRSPVTEVIEKYNALTEEQKKLCLDFIAPEPEPEAPKQTKKKRTTKSPRQQSISTALTSSREAKAGSAQANGQRCVARIPGLDVECNELAESPVHDPSAGYAGYHPFVPAAQPAEKKSKKKAAAASATPNSEIEKAAAISAGS